MVSSPTRRPPGFGQRTSTSRTPAARATVPEAGDTDGQPLHPLATVARRSWCTGAGGERGDDGERPTSAATQTGIPWPGRPTPRRRPRRRRRSRPRHAALGSRAIRRAAPSRTWKVIATNTRTAPVMSARHVCAPSLVWTAAARPRGRRGHGAPDHRCGRRRRGVSCEPACTGGERPHDRPTPSDGQPEGDTVDGYEPGHGAAAVRARAPGHRGGEYEPVGQKPSPPRGDVARRVGPATAERRPPRPTPGPAPRSIVPPLTVGHRPRAGGRRRSAVPHAHDALGRRGHPGSWVTSMMVWPPGGGGSAAR